MTADKNCNRQIDHQTDACERRSRGALLLLLAAVPLQSRVHYFPSHACVKVVTDVHSGTLNAVYMSLQGACNAVKNIGSASVLSRYQTFQACVNGKRQFKTTSTNVLFSHESTRELW